MKIYLVILSILILQLCVNDLYAAPNSDSREGMRDAKAGRAEDRAEDRAREKREEAERKAREEQEARDRAAAYEVRTLNALREVEGKAIDALTRESDLIGKSSMSYSRDEQLQEQGHAHLSFKYGASNAHNLTYTNGELNHSAVTKYRDELNSRVSKTALARYKSEVASHQDKMLSKLKN